MLAPFYRTYELAWEGDEEAQARFQRILRVGLVLLLALAILLVLLPPPRTAPGGVRGAGSSAIRIAKASSSGMATRRMRLKRVCDSSSPSQASS